MTEQHQTSSATRRTRALRRDIIRILAVILSIIALLLTSSALNWVTEAAAQGPKKAVVVAGPVHSKTEKYLGYASEIAAAAEAQGMEVIRIFHPNAPASRVKSLAQGANLFVYVGHGNGWPSRHGEFQEDTKNGLGLDAADPENRDPDTVVYKGADWLRENIALAPNAVVILSHLSYASGHANGDEPASREVAVQRVDNFANGFLSIGARVVWALGHQPGADIVKALHQEDATMDAVFMTAYRDGGNSRAGWIGHSPGYYDSVRIPGARINIDPHPTEGYLRAVTGDLGFSTTTWRGVAAAPPPDTTAPVVSALRVRQSALTIASAGSTAPVFTPNGDGISDVVDVSFGLSEDAFVEVKVKRAGGVVRRYSTWAQAGAGIVSWNGRNDNRKLVAEGKYNVLLTPTDRAGNRGPTELVSVKVLNSLKSPKVSQPLFWARDGDAIAPATAVKAKLIRPATVTYAIRDTRGKVVRRLIVDKTRVAGEVRAVWDGKDDNGRWVPDGRYTARVRVATSSGWYAHDIIVRHMAFQGYTPRWKRQRGDTVTLRLTSSEPLKGKPVVTANQRGIAKYQVPPRKVTRLSATQYRVVIDTRKGSKAGAMKVRVVGTDKRGGKHSKLFVIRLT